MTRHARSRCPPTSPRPCKPIRSHPVASPPCPTATSGGTSCPSPERAPTRLASGASSACSTNCAPADYKRRVRHWRVATRWILHVDLDEFIAAVEVLRRPELRGRPVVVGGDGDPAKRGVVATASYAAREFGVHSGIPLRTAARRCPDAVFLPVDRAAYEAVSERIMAVLRELTPAVEVMGWDEAFLAVQTGEPEAFARQIQDR